MNMFTPVLQWRVGYRSGPREYPTIPPMHAHGKHPSFEHALVHAQQQAYISGCLGLRLHARASFPFSPIRTDYAMTPSSSHKYLPLGGDAQLFASIEDYTAPGARPATMLLVHGFGESSEAWREWIPIVGADFRVVRPDVRGFGRSTPMPKDFGWSMQLVVDDLKRVVEQCNDGEPVHLVGAKSGSWMSMKLAADHPQLVRSLTVIGGAVKGGATAQWLADNEATGVAAWAAASMKGRFGTMLSAEAIRWWIELTAQTPLSTMQSYLRWVPTVDIAEDVARIRCPTLVIAADAGKLRPLSETTSWQRTIVGS
ncbi:MAG: alpha/beta hydrolase, partial [Betaproteobacteria bacterium]